MLFKRHAIIIAVLVLIAAALNFPVATRFIVPPRTATRGGFVVNGPKAAAFPWPERAPEGQPMWPPPDSYQLDKGFGHTRVNAISSFGRDKGGNGFQMMTDTYGWPLPCMSESNRWWSWDDPAMKTSERPEVPMHMLWRGTLLNPLILGFGAWLLVFAPLLSWRALRTWRRSRKRLCTRCGYPLVPTGTCPECGDTFAATPASV